MNVIAGLGLSNAQLFSNPAPATPRKPPCTAKGGQYAAHRLDLSESRACFSREPIELRPIGEIGRDCVDFDARARRDVVACRLEILGASSAEDELRAFVRQLERDGATKPATRRGDQRDLSAKTEIHGQRLR